MTELDEKMSLEFLLNTQHVITVRTSNIETGHLFHWNWKPRQSALHCRFGKIFLIYPTNDKKFNLLQNYLMIYHEESFSN